MADTVPLTRQVVVADDPLPGEARISAAAERVLSGERRGVRAVLPFLGPAFIASVAYIDPGNFATNMAGGSQFGYTLLWVVLAANLMAMLVQSMSAKLGIATGRSLPEVCRDRLPFRVVVLLWLQAEAVAMATDLAEFVGAALGLHLVFGLSLWVSAVLTGVSAFTILGLQVSGLLPTALWKTGENCSATVLRSPLCSTACSTTAISSNAGRGAGEPKQTCPIRRIRDKTQSRPGPSRMAGFEVTTHGRF